MARVNQLLREVLAEEIELVAAADSRLELVTVTAVACDPTFATPRSSWRLCPMTLSRRSARPAHAFKRPSPSRQSSSAPLN